MDLLRLSALAVSCLALTSGSVCHADLITLTPRIWLFSDNTLNATQVEAAFSSGDLERQVQDEIPGASVEILQTAFGTTDVSTADFLMYGGSVSFGVPAHQDIQVTVTGLYGSDREDNSGTGSVVSEQTIPGLGPGTVLTTYAGRTELHLKRRDFELVAQKTFGDTGTWSLVSGLRYEQINIEGEGRFRSYGAGVFDTDLGILGTIPLGTVVETQFNTRLETKQKLATGRFGVAAVINATDRQQFYANALVFAGRLFGENTLSYSDPSGAVAPASFEADFDARWFTGPDLSVGYLYQLTDTLTLDLRYRGLFFFPVGGNERTLETPRNTHGLNFGFSVRL